MPGLRVPQVVIFLIGGVLIGPHVLGLAEMADIQRPVLIIAVFLTKRGQLVALASVAGVGVLALALSILAWLARHRTVHRIIREGQDATGQTTLRWSVVLLFVLPAVASRFGLDVVLGAVLAGIVLRAWTRRLNIDTTPAAETSTKRRRPPRPARQRKLPPA